MVMTSTAFRFVLVLAAAFTAMPSAAKEVDEVALGTAGNYAILSKIGISTVPDSIIIGDIAVSPISATALTGFSLSADSTGEFSTSTQISGSAFSADYASPTPTHLTTAVGDMQIAYKNAAGRAESLDSDDLPDKTNIGAGTLGGVGNRGSENDPLKPAVYTFNTDLIIGGDLYLAPSAVDDDPEDVFIFRTTGSLKQVDYKRVFLADGVDAAKIFWQVAGFVEIGDGAHLEGILLVKTHILFKTGSSLHGRALAQTACDLQVATIAQP
jgi:hypothetical protein